MQTHTSAYLQLAEHDNFHVYTSIALALNAACVVRTWFDQYAVKNISLNERRTRRPGTQENHDEANIPGDLCSEDLHRVVLEVAHDHLVLRCDSDARDPAELSAAGALVAERAHMAAVWTTDLHPAVAAVTD